MKSKAASIIALTGGIACGKTLVAGVLSSIVRYELLNLDALAKDLMQSEPSIRVAIEHEISPNAYTPTGVLDKQWMRDEIFRDRVSRERLEAIVHPHVRKRWLQKIESQRSANVGLLIEFPLLYEVQAEMHFDCVVVVAASETTQIQRISEHRVLSEQMARKILASQMPISDKVARADHIIWNDSGMDLLKSQVAILSESLLRPQT